MIFILILLLDRDGVINVKLEGKYVQDFSEFKFISGSLSAISKLSQIFSRILIVTNQQGIGKGIMSQADLNTLHLKMQKQIVKHGGRIDKIYYCPHLESSNCLCRKPSPGMIKNDILDFPKIIIENSDLVGDSASDIEAGRIMKLNTVKVDSCYTLEKWTADLV